MGSEQTTGQPVLVVATMKKGSRTIINQGYTQWKEATALHIHGRVYTWLVKLFTDRDKFPKLSLITIQPWASETLSNRMREEIENAAIKIIIQEESVKGKFWSADDSRNFRLRKRLLEKIEQVAGNERAQQRMCDALNCDCAATQFVQRFLFSEQPKSIREAITETGKKTYNRSYYISLARGWVAYVTGEFDNESEAVIDAARLVEKAVRKYRIGKQHQRFDLMVHWLVGQ